MNILITGASGLIGTALGKKLRQAGHSVYAMSRTDKNAAFYWQPEQAVIKLDTSIKLDAVINLAGENIAEGRWTSARKNRIVNSRIQSTKILCKALSELEHKPQCLVSASAIGFYGDRGNTPADETSEPGSGFLTDIAVAWEAATKTAQEAGIRVVHIRTGIVLSPDGGALKKMLLPFKMGLGGIIGSGKQYMSWISIVDEVRAIEFLLDQPQLSGPFNLVAPSALTNREFTQSLGRVLKRPTPFPMPGFVAKILFGEMAEELLLSGVKVLPVRLQEAGFSFVDTDFEISVNSLVNGTPSAQRQGQASRPV